MRLAKNQNKPKPGQELTLQEFKHMSRSIKSKMDFFDSESYFQFLLSNNKG